MGGQNQVDNLAKNHENGMLNNHSLAWNNGFVNLSIIKIRRFLLGLHYLCSSYCHSQMPGPQIPFHRHKSSTILEQHYLIGFSVMMNMIFLCLL